MTSCGFNNLDRFVYPVKYIIRSEMLNQPKYIVSRDDR